MDLNENALRRCEILLDRATELKVSITAAQSGTRIIDCGVKAPGGLEAGRALAEVCMAGLGKVKISASHPAAPGPAVVATSDQPLAACMASQYAGWRITGEDFFAMGSGPMRAAAGREELFQHIGFRESASNVVGVLESGHLPANQICEQIAADCGIEAHNLTLLVAPTSSIAGSIQIVARTIETALHKMHELKVDISRVTSGMGCAPLPPIAADDLVGIGRTNDAVLYGGEVTLWMRGDDASLASFGPQIPSSASPDHGRPFGEIFERYDRDFYKIDPLLFSPAVVTLVNLDTGRSFRFGDYCPEVLAESFGR